MFPELKGKSTEINQVGIELIGGEKLRSDLEVVELAARCLSTIGNGKYRLELCDIGYFKAIMNSLDVDEDTKEEIRYQIEQKNYASLTDMLGKYKDSKAAQALLKLPRLFGGAEAVSYTHLGIWMRETMRILITERKFLLPEWC